MSKTYPYLVAGHARGGTMFMKNTLIQHGITVGGGLTEAGTATWRLLARDDLKFDFVIHCLRDPLKALPSIYRTETPHATTPKEWYGAVKDSHDFRMKFLNINDLNIYNCVVKSFLRWHNFIESKFNINLVVQIENPQPLYDYLKSIGKVRDESKKVDQNSRKHWNSYNEEFRWDFVDKDLMQELDLWCVRHGYDRVTSRLA